MDRETRKEEPSSAESGAAGKDYTRQLGVIEALVAITNQCPSAPVRAVAQQSLDSIKSGDSEGLRKQVFYVLTAMKGWRGERARQVHESLNSFLESGKPDARDPGAK